MSDTVRNLTVESFAGQDGEIFLVSSGAVAPVELVLVQVDDLRHTMEGREADFPRDPFALLLRGPLEPILAPALYQVEHAQHGVLDLFLSPVQTQETDGIYYEIVFN